MTERRQVYFPLSSNAHSLLVGAPLNTVRRRLKLASLLHDDVYLESGSMQIQAGPTGASAMRSPSSDDPAEWQTPTSRKHLQATEFVLSIGPSGTAPESTSMQEVLRSSATIGWEPTFEPFRRELPSAVDWIHIGQFEQLRPEEKAARRRWRHRDDGNVAIAKRLPDALTRSQVLRSVEDDLALGAARGLQISIDPLHAAIVSSRLADPRLTVSGFALPVLVPRVGNMAWADIAELRKQRAMKQLRDVLNEIEQESLADINQSGELADAVKRRYRARLESLAADTPSVSGAIGTGLAELAVGGVIGFATAGLSWLGVVAGAGPGVALTAVEAASRSRARRNRSWISAMQALAAVD